MNLSSPNALLVPCDGSVPTKIPLCHKDGIDHLRAKLDSSEIAIRCIHEHLNKKYKAMVAYSSIHPSSHAPNPYFPLFCGPIVIFALCDSSCIDIHEYFEDFEDAVLALKQYTRRNVLELLGLETGSAFMDMSGSRKY
jgi:hypothetical protein